MGRDIEIGGRQIWEGILRLDGDRYGGGGGDGNGDGDRGGET